jgi:nitrilase
MKIAIAQISPVWLNQKETIKKINNEILKAGKKNADLIVFGEALLPGYPFWISTTNGAQFDNSLQKELFAIYQNNAVDLEAGDIKLIQQTCYKEKIACYLGCVEKTKERSGFTLYCSLVYINKLGEIKSVHRKLVPTYEERLVWGNGDGNGLKTHDLEEFTVGGLNCWENWMPLSRTALYAQGENLHVAVWPGSDYNTNEITRFIARESRSYVISASCLLNIEGIESSLPGYDLIRENATNILANGGSCIAKPNGDWLIEPIVNQEQLVFAELDIREVAKERQNFDPVGHYSRPDVLSLNLNSERQKILHTKKLNRNFYKNLGCNE